MSVKQRTGHRVKAAVSGKDASEVSTQVRRENSELSKTRTRSPTQSRGCPVGTREVSEQHLASVMRAGSPGARAVRNHERETTAWGGGGAAASHRNPRRTIGFFRSWTCIILVKMPSMCTKVPQRGIYCARCQCTHSEAGSVRLAGRFRETRVLELRPPSSFESWGSRTCRASDHAGVGRRS